MYRCTSLFFAVGKKEWIYLVHKANWSQKSKGQFRFPVLRSLKSYLELIYRYDLLLYEHQIPPLIYGGRGIFKHF